MRLLDYIITKGWQLTHRVQTITEFNNHKEYVPQWWFLWWHNYWEEKGYQYMVPRYFTTLYEVYDFLIPYWEPGRKGKLEFYKKQDQINKNLEEVKKDF